MSTATLPALHASQTIMSSVSTTSSSSTSRRLTEIGGDIIAEELPWVPRDCHHSHPPVNNSPSAVNSSSAESPRRAARFENDPRDDEIFNDDDDDDSSHEGDDINMNGEAHATPPEAMEDGGASRGDSSKAVRRSLADVEMRALEGKLKLLDVQRELSSLHCQRFIHVLESTLHASRSAPTTPFPTNNTPNHSRPSNKPSAGSDPLFGGDAAGAAAPSLGLCNSLPWDYYAGGGSAGSHDHDLQRSLPTRSVTLSLSLARSRSTPGSLHNRQDSPRVRRAATAATPRSSRRHRAAATAAAAIGF